jgi:hypothetical protein
MTTGFDDYLRRIEEIKREATLAERDRIRNLLIDHVLQMANTPSESWAENTAIKVDALNVAIALIKGENK